MRNIVLKYKCFDRSKSHFAKQTKLKNNMISPTLFLILFRNCFAHRSMQNIFQDVLQLATQEAQHLARYDIESSEEDEILSRRSRFFSRSELCVAQKLR